MSTGPAAQDVDILVVVRAGKICRTNHDLPVSILVARLGRRFTHSGQYTHPGSGALIHGFFQGTSNVLQANAMPFVAFSPTHRFSWCLNPILTGPSRFETTKQAESRFRAVLAEGSTQVLLHRDASDRMGKALPWRQR